MVPGPVQWSPSPGRDTLLSAASAVGQRGAEPIGAAAGEAGGRSIGRLGGSVGGCFLVFGDTVPLCP